MKLCHFFFGNVKFLKLRLAKKKEIKFTAKREKRIQVQINIFDSKNPNQIMHLEMRQEFKKKKTINCIRIKIYREKRNQCRLVVKVQKKLCNRLNVIHTAW